jgi:two-component system, NtrC family, sensor histidine kinase HydH
MKIFQNIKLRYIIAIAIVISLLMIISAYFELTQSRQELYQMMTEQATSLIETITISGVNTIVSSSEIENLISQRLLTAGRMIAHLDSTTTLKQYELKQFADENDIYRINIFDKYGNKILSNHIPEPTHLEYEPKHSPFDFIKPILKNEKRDLIIGIKEARLEDGMRYAVAVQRTKNKPGAIVLNVDAAYLLEFRKKIGLGKIIQDIGNNEGIEYILLQDDEGIIAASKSVTDTEPIDKDSFLQHAHSCDTIQTRVYPVNGEEVFEVAKSFKVEGQKIGLLRVGLSMNQIHSLEERMVRRSVIISIVLLVIAAIIISIIFVNQNLEFVKKEYDKIQTYTGNILQNMADAVLTTDKVGNITIFNKRSEELFGIGAKEAVGKNVSQVCDGKLKFLSDSLTKQESINNSEIEIDCKKRKRRVLSVNTTFAYDKHNHLDAFTAVIRDLTEVRKMESQIKQREKLSAMGELASGVAHEIKNPLNSIYMIGQRFRKEFKPEENIREYKSLTDALISEVQRVNKIILQFLDFARPPRLKLTEVSSKILINELRALIGSQAIEKGITFEIIEKNELLLKIDYDQIKQAFLNLFQNSIEATPAAGHLKMIITTNNNKAVFEIEDTGKGIAPENLSKIFNIYFTTKQDGVGLGLSMVQQIISQHNGNLFVESQLGIGTKFIVELPLSSEKE